jgi:ribosomal protein RSM22 (predicted rRNA methylase)
MTESLENILDQGGRTNKQLQKTLENIMKSHRDLVGRRERERSRLLHEKEYKSSEQHKDEKITPVFYGPNETLAAFKYRLLPTYAVVRRVLEESKSLIGRKAWSPKRVLDFGIGSGSASAAAMDLFDDIEWIHGVDASATMREGAKIFMEDYSKQGGRQSPPRITLAAHLSQEASPATFDLVLFAYTATEFTHHVATLAAAVDLEARYLDSEDDDLGLELLRGDANRISFGRIIRAPMKRTGHVLIDCCVAPGRIERHKIMKSTSKIAPGIYHAARKSRWGGFWPDVESTKS